MPKILITGGAGFIAGALALRLSEKADCDIVAVDNFTTSTAHAVPKGKHHNIRFIKCDVNDYKDIAAVFFAGSFDYVFHFAALVGVRRTLDQPVSVLRDIEGIRNILDLSKNTGVKRVYYSSSSEVYGEPVQIPQHEHTTPLNSRLPYAIVKNVGEAFLKSYQQEFGLEYTIFRFFNTYGPGQSPDFVISKFLMQALQGKPITIFGSGNQTRTFCYIEDNISTIVRIFEENLVVNDVINIGSDVETTILSLATLIAKQTGRKSEIQHLPALEEGDMTRRQPDIQKMMHILNRPLIDLETGINQIIKAWGN
jgi:UDP-glucose 4-epimerase